MSEEQPDIEEIGIGWDANTYETNPAYRQLYDERVAKHRASKKGICTNCLVRPATHNWVGEGGFMSYIHGMFVRWCELCVVSTQVEACRKSVNELPKLEARLEELKKLDVPPVE